MAEAIGVDVWDGVIQFSTKAGKRKHFPARVHSLQGRDVFCDCEIVKSFFYGILITCSPWFLPTLFTVVPLALIPFSLQQRYVAATRSITHVLQALLMYTLDSEASRCTDSVSSRRRKGKRLEETVDYRSCNLCNDPVSVQCSPGNRSCHKQFGFSRECQQTGRLLFPS